MRGRTLHESFRARQEDSSSKVPIQAIATFREIVLEIFYALMFSWANLEGQPLRRRGAAGRMLGQAFGSLKERRFA